MVTWSSCYRFILSWRLLLNYNLKREPIYTLLSYSIIISISIEQHLISCVDMRRWLIWPCKMWLWEQRKWKHFRNNHNKSRPWNTNQVPLVRRAAKEEVEEEAREELREKRRGTSASLVAGSRVREGAGRRSRHSERPTRRKRSEKSEGWKL